MYATHRRYEGIDQNRVEELGRKVNESLIPKLSKLSGFKGYFLMEAGEGVVRSTTLFDTLRRPRTQLALPPSGRRRRSSRSSSRMRRRSPSAR
jgi:hypothetical protein